MKRKPTVSLPVDVRKLGETLIDEQMWCWGCDVRRAEGNLLLAYGFEKRPSPNPRFHSAYTLPLCATCALTIWGWGIWIADTGLGSAFISRTRFQVFYTPNADLQPCAWQADQLPLSVTDCTDEPLLACTLLTQACRFAADYETWLSAQVERDYRETVISAWPQRRRHKGGIAAGEIASAWVHLAYMVNPVPISVKRTVKFAPLRR